MLASSRAPTGCSSRSTARSSPTTTPPSFPSKRGAAAPRGTRLETAGHRPRTHDARIVPFEEGDVVTGKVVRIDKDEVLVDIGYKSEGGIPNNELSLRKSVDPHE